MVACLGCFGGLDKRKRGEDETVQRHGSLAPAIKHPAHGRGRHPHDVHSSVISENFGIDAVRERGGSDHGKGLVNHHQLQMARSASHNAARFRPLPDQAPETDAPIFKHSALMTRCSTATSAVTVDLQWLHQTAGMTPQQQQLHQQQMHQLHVLQQQHHLQMQLLLQQQQQQMQQLLPHSPLRRAGSSASQHPLLNSAHSADQVTAHLQLPTASSPSRQRMTHPFRLLPAPPPHPSTDPAAFSLPPYHLSRLTSPLLPLPDQPPSYQQQDMLGNWAATTSSGRPSAPDDATASLLSCSSTHSNDQQHLGAVLDESHLPDSITLSLYPIAILSISLGQQNQGGGVTRTATGNGSGTPLNGPQIDASPSWNRLQQLLLQQQQQALMAASNASAVSSARTSPSDLLGLRQVSGEKALRFPSIC